MNNTPTVSNENNTLSEKLISTSAATLSFAILPKKTRLYIHSVYAAAQIKVDAAATDIQKFALKALRIIMNSPTNPEVPGSPALDIAKIIKNAAKTGMVFATPPKSFINRL